MSSQALANVAQSSKALSISARIALASDLLSHGIVLFMLFRTFLFIFRRRQGEAGPGETPLLLKFWSNYGVLHSFSLVLSQYLTPFGLSWVPSIFRALFVLFISAGRRLPLSTHVYERATSSIHESAEPEVEQCLLQAREQWAQHKDELEAAARNLIDRAASGGVSSLVETKPSASAQAAPRDKLPEPVVPPAQTSQKFFAGQSERRVKTRAETSYKALRGVITSAQSEAPQPAYAASIAFRRAFRERRTQKETTASEKSAATEE